MSQFTDKQAKILRAFADQIDKDGSDGAGFAHWLLKLYRNIRSTFTG